jgi:hypothetical protein
MSQIVECKPISDISSVRDSGLLASFFQPLPDIPKRLATVKENVIIMDSAGDTKVLIISIKT